jgi:hypothetical protein
MFKQTEVALAAFDAADVGAVQPAHVNERLLREGEREAEGLAPRAGRFGAWWY